MFVYIVTSQTISDLRCRIYENLFWIHHSEFITRPNSQEKNPMQKISVSTHGQWTLFRKKCFRLQTEETLEVSLQGI